MTALPPKTAAAEDLLRSALGGPLRGRIALISSFGAESVALLDIVARVDRATPVLFLDTEMLFPETLDYQREIAARLCLEDLRIIRPDAKAVLRTDPNANLHQSDPDRCCALRKVAPLREALGPFQGWITGRKRRQSEARASLPEVEIDTDGRLKLNPLVSWDRAEVASYIAARGLPPHPLVAQGFPSIGCAPCTSPTDPGEAERDGRWRGGGKTECGIHFGPDGASRTAA